MYNLNTNTSNTNTSNSGTNQMNNYSLAKQQQIRLNQMNNYPLAMQQQIRLNQINQSMQMNQALQLLSNVSGANNLAPPILSIPPTNNSLPKSQSSGGPSFPRTGDGGSEAASPPPSNKRLKKDSKAAAGNTKSKQGWVSTALQLELQDKTLKELDLQDKTAVGRHSILNEENYYLKIPDAVRGILVELRKRLQLFYLEINAVHKASDHNVDKIMLDWRGYETSLVKELMLIYDPQNKELVKMALLSPIVEIDNISPSTSQQLRNHPWTCNRKNRLEFM